MLTNGGNLEGHLIHDSGRFVRYRFPSPDGRNVIVQIEDLTRSESDYPHTEVSGFVRHKIGVEQLAYEGAKRAAEWLIEETQGK